MRKLMSSLRRIFSPAAILMAIAAPTFIQAGQQAGAEINAGFPGSRLSVNTLIVDPASPSTIYAQTSGSLAGLALLPPCSRARMQGNMEDGQ